MSLGLPRSCWGSKNPEPVLLHNVTFDEREYRVVTFPEGNDAAIEVLHTDALGDKSWRPVEMDATRNKVLGVLLRDLAVRLAEKKVSL